MNVIKISKNVFEIILNDDIKPIDIDHMPFGNFCIAFPYSFFRSAEEMIEDALKHFKKHVNDKGMGFKQALEVYKKEIEQFKQIVSEYVESDLYVTFSPQNYEIQVKHSNPKLASFIFDKEELLFRGINFGGIINSETIIPIVSINQFGAESVWLYKTLLKLISGVLYAINNPQYVEIESIEERILLSKKSKKNKKKRYSNIRYITNIKYLSNAPQESETKTRVYSMEAWEVRGHWRHLKSGKKIWVNSYIKGDKEKFRLQENKILILNRIERE